MKRIWVNRKYIAKLATKWTGSVFALVGLLGTFVSLSDFLDSNISIQCRTAISLSILCIVWLLSFVGGSICVWRKNKYEVLELNGGYHVYVQYGDLFSEAEVTNPSMRRNIVIPVNRCFDTKVDDDLISSNTLHGIALKNLYTTGLFDENSLNLEIQEQLHNLHIPFTTLQREEKRSGNLARYPAGTVIEVKVSDTCTYFFLALSTFDKNLKATTTDDDYVLALMKMLEFCNDRSQQFPVVMPLIGGGLSRTQKSESSILKYIVKLIELNKNLIHFDMHIVIRDSAKNSVAITDI